MSGRLVARLVHALIVALLLSLLGSPAQAYDPAEADEERRAKLQDVDALDSTGNENNVPANASALGEALAAAKELGERVEVESLRTEYDTVYANPDGTFTEESAQTPIRVADESGELVPVDTDLAKTDGRLEPKASPDDVSLSSTGKDDLASLILADGTSISLDLPQLELAAPKIDGEVATYEVTSAPTQPSAPEPSPETEPLPTPAPAEPAPESDEATPVEPASFRTNETIPAADSVRVGVGAGGFAAHVLLENAPEVAPEYVFNFVAPGLTAELVADVLVFRDASGVVVAQSAPLAMWDAQVDKAGLPTNQAPVVAELTQDGETWRLVLRPSMDFLTADSTVYPVVVDPDITSATRLGNGYVMDGAFASSSYTGGNIIQAGSNGLSRSRAFASFAYNQYYGATVTSATLKLTQASGICSAGATRIYSVTGNDGPAPTWNNQQTFSTDPRFSSGYPAASASNCIGASQAADVTNIVSGWAGNHVGPNAKPFAQRDVYNNRMVFMLTADNETDSSRRRAFCARVSTATSCTAADAAPTLSVTYTPEVGQQSWYSMTSRPLGDRMSLAVNNRNGNLVVQNADIDVAGVGLDFNLQRTYNSQGVENGPLGPRWSLSMGPDVWLEKKSEFRFDFHGPGGTVIGSYTRKSANPADAAYNQFTTPLGGAGADLVQNGAEFTLTFRQNQSKYVFGQADANGNTYMRYLRDRSNNQIEVQYSGTAGAKPKVSQFIDSAGRTYTPTYSGNLITQINAQSLPGVGQRGWVYGYTSGNLTSSNDAIGNPTSYEYVTSSGDTRLSKIIQPNNQSGAAPTTEITYQASSAEVATIGARLNNSGTGLLTYSWQFNTTATAACQGNGQQSTVITDARGKPTTYCYAQRDNSASNSKIWVYDALGKPRSEDYSADNQPLSSTSAGNQSLTADGSTVNTYNNDITDQLSSATQPKNGSTSGQAASSNVNYGGTPTTVQGGTYLPSDVKNAAGDCNAFEYDSMGRTTASFAGISSTGSTCGSKTAAGVTKTQSEYNPNGTTSKTWDANAGVNGPATLTDAEKTVYTYWQTTDPGFVVGTQWQVKSIKKPGGDCSNTAARRLCTSFTYDGAGRVQTETDGRGEVIAYAYDLQDRTTRVFYNGATEFNCLLLALAGDCILYGYDAAGNLIDRRSQEGFSVFYYDRTNRQVQVDTPAGGGALDTVAMAYDAVDNLISYHQTVSGTTLDITNYGYDDANRPNVVINAFGVTNVATDADGRTSAITFPDQAGYPGTRVNYAYTNAGEPKQMTWKTRDNATELATWDYSYTKNIGGIIIDTPQQQSRQVSSAYTSVVTPGTTSYAYNQQKLMSATDTAGPDYTYTYDNVGNILSEKIDATTTHYGYDKASELCWQGGVAGSATQKLSLTCATGPTGSTPYTSDAAGNNLGTTATPIAYNDDSQVTNIGGKAQTYLDQGNDLRNKSASTRFINGPLGVTAIIDGGQTIFVSRLPDGTPLTFRPTSGTQAYFISEPDGDVSFLVDPFGYTVGSYSYSPYGKTTVGGGISQFNPFRWLGQMQETTAAGTPGVYKLGARYYDTNGHFTQPDALSGTMGDPRTMTSYSYAGADPINMADSSGYAIRDAIKKTIAKADDAVGKVTKVKDYYDIAKTIYKKGIKKAIPKIGGLAAGAVVGFACTGVSAGAGSVACGTAGIGVSYVTEKALEEKF